LKRFLPTGNWVWACLPPALVLIATGLDRNYQTDLWHHLARGRAMAEQGRLVHEDLFAFTIDGQPIHADANWLTQLAFFRLFQLGGLPLLQLVNSLLLAATIALVVWLAWRKSGSMRLAALLAVFTFLGLWQILLIRPQTLSLLLFTLMLAILELSETRRWLLMLPPLLVVFWVNMHGAFPVGVMLVGCYWLAAAWQAGFRQALRDRQVQCLFVCLLASALATLVNPYGADIYQFVGITSSRSTSRNIQEWLPPRLDTLIGKFWVASLLLALAVLPLPQRRPMAREVILALCFVLLSCSAVRMVAWWLLALPLVTAGQLAAALPQRWREDEDAKKPSCFAGFVITFLALLVLASAPLLEHVSPLPRRLGRDHRLEDDLEAAAEHLRTQPTPHRRLFSRLDWGEYLGWSLAPDGFQVFMDGRIDLYPDEVWFAYRALLSARADWQGLLEHWQVDCLVLDETHADQQHGLLAFVRQSPRWSPTCRVGPVVVFRRR